MTSNSFFLFEHWLPTKQETTRSSKVASCQSYFIVIPISRSVTCSNMNGVDKNVDFSSHQISTIESGEQVGSETWHMSVVRFIAFLVTCVLNFCTLIKIWCHSNVNCKVALTQLPVALLITFMTKSVRDISRLFIKYFVLNSFAFYSVKIAIFSRW